MFYMKRSFIAISGCDNHRIVSLLNKSILFNFYELSYIDIGDKRAGIFI